VNFGPVTLEFKKGKEVHSLVDQQFGYIRGATARPCGGSVLSFAITTQFSLTYRPTLDGVTAMPHGLHARLYHAFLVAILSWHLHTFWSYVTRSIPVSFLKYSIACRPSAVSVISWNTMQLRPIIFPLHRLMTAEPPGIPFLKLKISPKIPKISVIKTVSKCLYVWLY